MGGRPVQSIFESQIVAKLIDKMSLERQILYYENHIGTRDEGALGRRRETGPQRRDIRSAQSWQTCCAYRAAAAETGFALGRSPRDSGVWYRAFVGGNGESRSRRALVIYLDTSAFLKLYIRERGSELVQAAVTSQEDPLPVWDLLQAEMVNSLHLKVFWGELAAAGAERLVGLFQERLDRGQYFVPDVDRPRLFARFRELAKRTPEFGCRTMDIVHVACALVLEPEMFISFDKRQRALAKAVKLRVVPEETV